MPEMLTEVDLKGLLGRTLLKAEKPYANLRFYLAGRLSAPLPAPRVAVVGTSDPSPEGLDFAVRLAENLRERVTVVSGLIRGIGVAVLKAVIDRGGTAVAVLGSPIEAPRPPEIRELQLRLMREHVVVSQFLSGSPLTLKEDSPVIMERAVALLSDVLVVAEAGESEPVHAVREAVRLGRKVFVSGLVERQEPSWFREIKEAYDVEVLSSPDLVDEVLDPDNFVANPEMRRFLKVQRLAHQSVLASSSPAKGMWREAKRMLKV